MQRARAARGGGHSRAVGKTRSKDQIGHGGVKGGLSGKAGVGFGHFPFPQLLFCRLNSAHHRRQPRGIFVDANAKINLGAAGVFAKLRHQDQDFVLRLRGESF